MYELFEEKYAVKYALLGVFGLKTLVSTTLIEGESSIEFRQY